MNAPDPYARHLQAMRTANATQSTTFESKWKADRLADMEATRRALDAEEPAPRLIAAELAPYRAPNAFEAGLQALREKEARS